MQADVTILNLLALVLVSTPLSTCHRQYAVNCRKPQNNDEPYYHSNAEIAHHLYWLASNYPNQTHWYHIGESENGAKIWVLAIAKFSPERHVQLRPDVKLVGGIHGDEPVGIEVTLCFAHFLLDPPDRYRDDVDLILSRYRIHLLPCMNPDGYKIAHERFDRARIFCSGRGGRENANLVDLNRDFPDWFNQKYQPMLQQETKVVMNWIKNNRFILSIAYHSGSMLVNIPYDRKPPNSANSKCPDHDVFYWLAKQYTKEYGWGNNTCRHGSNNTDDYAVFVGEKWYSVKGGMQDYNYNYHGILEFTIELACCKMPDPIALQLTWETEKNALLSLLKSALFRVQGRVLDADGNGIPNVIMNIGGITSTFNTSIEGEFWRILHGPGSYKLEYLVPNYPKMTQSFEIAEDQTSNIVINILMKDFETTSTPTVKTSTGLFSTQALSTIDLTTQSSQTPKNSLSKSTIHHTNHISTGADSTITPIQESSMRTVTIKTTTHHSVDVLTTSFHPVPDSSSIGQTYPAKPSTIATQDTAYTVISNTRKPPTTRKLVTFIKFKATFGTSKEINKLKTSTTTSTSPTTTSVTKEITDEGTVGYLHTTSFPVVTKGSTVVESKLCFILLMLSCILCK